MVRLGIQQHGSESRRPQSYGVHESIGFRDRVKKISKQGSIARNMAVNIAAFLL